MSENEILLRKAIKGDGDAFIELVTPHEKMMYAVCLRMMGSESDAKDCAQEAMLKAFRSINRYEPRAAFSTWLYRIAYNVCLDLLRTRKRKAADSLEAKQEDEGFEASDGQTPYEQLEKKERMLALNSALDKLNPDDKAMMLLRAGQGLAYEEIAQVMNLPTGTVKSRLNRAREKLKKFLWADRELFSSAGVFHNEREEE